jgi:hypothetical protein
MTSLKLREGEETLDFAIRRGRKGPVIYPLNEKALTALKHYTDETYAHYEWRRVGGDRREALETCWKAFSQITKKMHAENFKFNDMPHVAKKLPFQDNVDDVGASDVAKAEGNFSSFEATVSN